MSAGTVVALVILGLALPTLIILSISYIDDYLWQRRRNQRKEHFRQLQAKIERDAEDASYAMFQEAVRHGYDPKNRSGADNSRQKNNRGDSSKGGDGSVL